MRKFILLISFFSGAPILFLSSILFYLFLSHQNNPPQARFSNNQHTKAVAYAALPSNQNVLGAEIEASEARVETIRQFMAKYNSPLEPHADYIVEVADAYGLDFRLIPAIAMQESGLCRRIPHGSHNCWGFGIYGGKITRFDNYKEGIETVSRTLATKYKNKGLITPEEIMTMYTPGSDGSWARAVNHFMEKMQ